MGNKRKFSNFRSSKGSGDSEHGPKKKGRFITPLSHGMNGILFVHDPMKEGAAVKEAFRVTEEYLDEYLEAKGLNGKSEGEGEGEGKGKGGDEGNDGGKGKGSTVKDALEEELAALRSKSEKDVLERVNVNSRGVFMIKVNVPGIDIQDFVHFILTDFEEKKVRKLRFVSQAVPVDTVAYSKIDDLGKTIKPLLDKVLNSPSREACKYKIWIKRRNNKSLDREEIQKSLGALVDSKHGVDFKNAECVVAVNVIGSLVCITVSDHFDRFFEYNVNKVCRVKEESGEGGNVGGEEGEGKEGEEKEEEGEEKEEEGEEKEEAA
jgi:hypothetical protein